MSDAGNIISIIDRKPISGADLPVGAPPAPQDDDTVETTLEWIDKIRAQAEKGNLENFIVISFAPKNDMFFADFMPAVGGLSAALASRFVATLEQMKMEMIEIASYMPVLSVDGDVIDPHAMGDDE